MRLASLILLNFWKIHCEKQQQTLELSSICESLSIKVSFKKVLNIYLNKNYVLKGEPIV